MSILNTIFKKKIAVLDKDINQYSLYKRILEKRINCKVIYIENYEKFNVSDYDLVISDLDLDFNILGSLENNFKNIPIILIAEDTFDLNVSEVNKLSNFFLTKHDCLFHVVPKVSELLSQEKKSNKIKKAS